MKLTRKRKTKRYGMISQTKKYGWKKEINFLHERIGIGNKTVR